MKGTPGHRDGSSSNKLRLVIGAGALLLAAAILSAILLPHALALLSAWCVVEVLFWIFVFKPTAVHYNRQPPGGHWPDAADQETDKHFQRFLQYCKEAACGIDHAKYISGWFMGVELDSIRRQNVEEFAAYGFCYKSREQLQAIGRGDLPSKMVEELSTLWHEDVKPGRNPNIKFMAHLWEPLNASYRPLAFYLATELTSHCAGLLLRRWGFQHHRHAGVDYHTLHLQPVPLKPPVATDGPAARNAAAAQGLCGPAGALLSNTRNHLVTHTNPAAGSSNGRCSTAELGTAAARQAPAAAGPAPPAAEQDGGLFDSPFATASSDKMCEELTCPSSQLDGLPECSPDHAALGAQGMRQRMRSVPTAQQHNPTRPQLMQRASCSVIKPRLAPQTSLLLTHTASATQAALTEALSEAGAQDAWVPVVFLHGIGGLPAYLELLLHLIAGGHPLLAVEVKSVAMRLGPVRSVPELADAVLGMMDKMGVQRACLVAHSYGTFTASYLLRNHPDRVQGCVLIDPVCMGMFLPNLIYNFLYKPVIWQGWGKPQLVAFVKGVVRVFLASELHVRTAVSRRFYWTQLNAWPEDLPAGSTILLSGKDDLMDSPEVKIMLQGANHIKVIYNEELAHGAFLLNAEVKQAIKDEVKRLLASSGSAVLGLAHKLSTLVPPGAAEAAGSLLPRQMSVTLQQMLRQASSMQPQQHRAGGRPAAAAAGAGAAAGAPGGQQAAQPLGGAGGKGAVGKHGDLAAGAAAGGWDGGVDGDARCDAMANDAADQEQAAKQKGA